jgi:pimeloyl-ACP methyl ester carboxylesterase
MAASAMEERFLDSPRPLRYLIGGTGPPLLLCHGWLGSAENFETWFEGIGKRRTLVIPDLPGCGESPPLPGRHTCAALARSIEPLIDALGLERFDLGGLCLGSGVAFELLARRPERVDRLILHTPLLDPSLVRVRFHLQAAVMLAPPVFPVISWLSRRRLVSDLYKRLIVEGSDVDTGQAEMNFRNQQRASHRAQREWVQTGLHRRDAGLLAAHRGESLVLVASDDRLLRWDALQRMVEGMPRVRFACMSDAGHGWNEDFIRRQLDAVGGFLDAAPPPGASAAA